MMFDGLFLIHACIPPDDALIERNILSFILIVFSVTKYAEL
jgi:hypothetical protein